MCFGGGVRGCNDGLRHHLLSERIRLLKSWFLALIHSHKKSPSLSSASPLLLFHTLLHRLSSLTTDRAETESTEERNSERRRRKEREGKRVGIQGKD